MKTLTLKADQYRSLLTRVKKALIEGQSRIEQERVRTYWETGRVIHADILKHKGRGEYGAEVTKRLAEDLDINLSVLQRCIQFAKTYPQLPKVGGHRLFNWSHYVKLMTVSDDRKRSQLEKQAAEKEWTADELAERIKEASPVERGDIAHHSTLSTHHSLKVPKIGSFYTYTTFTPPEVFAVTGEVMADLGFDVWKQVRVKEWPGAQFKAKSEYTYRAAVERVIDGDTLWVNIDLGFKAFTRQKLRLNGIDAPEISTAAGVKAKAFVAKALKGAETITVVTSKSDKYDRYLADIFIEPSAVSSQPSAKSLAESRELNADSLVYLNQMLLDEGLATIWK